MSIWQIVLVGVLNFVNIQGRAFQQLNVMHHKVAWVPLLSMQMALCEVFLWGGAAIIAVKGTWLQGAAYVVVLGVSGALGCIFSMYLHKWLRQRKQGEDNAVRSSTA